MDKNDGWISNLIFLALGIGYATGNSTARFIVHAILWITVAILVCWFFTVAW